MAAVAAAYLIYVVRKVQNDNIPFIKAFNPFYTKERNEMVKLKKSLSPIVKEIETQEMATFIKYWTEKFENNTLSEKDVLELNSQIQNGEQNQVNGILALHPEGRHLFAEINQQLKLKADALLYTEVETESEVLG